MHPNNLDQKVIIVFIVLTDKQCLLEKLKYIAIVRKNQLQSVTILTCFFIFMSKKYLKNTNNAIAQVSVEIKKNDDVEEKKE